MIIQTPSTLIFLMASLKRGVSTGRLIFFSHFWVIDSSIPKLILPEVINSSVASGKYLLPSSAF